MRKFLVWLVALMLIVSVFGVKKIVFWTAPNEQQEMFWKPLVKQ